MVNSSFTHQGGVTSLRLAERRLVLSYAPARSRDALAALLALDDTLADVLRTTRDAMVGQMRLTWWHDALSRLADAPPPAQPVLAALAAHVARPEKLARVVEGWEELLDPGDLDDAALLRFADARGAALFAAAGAATGAAATDPLAAAGRGWALADLAAHSRDPALAGRCRALAAPPLDVARRARWSRGGRPLGAMAHLARLEGRGAARRTARALVHRLTGM